MRSAPAVSDKVPFAEIVICPLKAASRSRGSSVRLSGYPSFSACGGVLSPPPPSMMKGVMGTV